MLPAENYLTGTGLRATLGIGHWLIGHVFRVTAAAQIEKDQAKVQADGEVVLTGRGSGTLL
ncbi:hypothetical protein GCM10008955_13260 [Deinococcus malanensis]|uniref:Uncharacterized protein n=1 Tax=Deinococcus malanensis TaxID=1706855 RepID=A0ABQ2EQ73_9DEIO|nr:hypothetical protein GCM10008955_13260 [Deinococcus malanensis]